LEFCICLQTPCLTWTQLMYKIARIQSFAQIVSKQTSGWHSRRVKLCYYYELSPNISRRAPGTPSCQGPHLPQPVSLGERNGVNLSLSGQYGPAWDGPLTNYIIFLTRRLLPVLSDEQSDSTGAVPGPNKIPSAKAFHTSIATAGLGIALLPASCQTAWA
jgi:hypothetical protein